MTRDQIDPAMQETAFPEWRDTAISGKAGLRDKRAAAVNIEGNRDTMLNLGESEITALSGATEGRGRIIL